ncbi:ethanolamine utilization protein EutP [Proteiniclasticum ruminis]|uniref:Ethanolamine utilization protein EutP n=2 Tax=Proteiniclasticum ruminis TaxID=398199 RepID=A0A1I4XJW0_9CLOT|nr:ethanolamine utilization protein EutP [Proteiniclasticum ruminis]
MKKMMLIGRTDSGKTTLADVLQKGYSDARKTQSIETVGTIVDTPGEFAENRRLYRALLITSYDTDVVAMVMDAGENHTLFPPNFALAFNREVIGIVTKKDLNSDTAYAESSLLKAGAERLFIVSAHTGEGLEELKKYLSYKEESS